MRKPHSSITACVTAAALASLLAGCGGGREDRAVEACAAAIAERLSDKNYRIDPADMAAKAKAEGDDVLHLRSSIVFDPGLPREYTQTFDCKARFADGGAPDVISLTFTW